MATNCINTLFKEAINDNKLPYIDKAMVIFDNSLDGASMSSERANELSIYTIGDNITWLDSHTGVERQSNTLIQAASTVSIPTKCRFTFPLSVNPTRIFNYLTGTAIPSNFQLKKSDILRMTSLTEFQVNGLYMYDCTQDEYNIEMFGKLIELEKLSIGGKFQYWWQVDLVFLADELIANGRSISSQNVLVMCISNGGYINNLLVNGTAIQLKQRWVHYVFNSAGYSIYNINSASVLNDYSGETPLYTKTLN